MIVFLDWKFLAEGGHHVVLEYCGDDDSYKGKVLRVEKKIPSMGDFHNIRISEEKYLSNVMTPLLSSTYINYPQPVNVDSLFVQELNCHLRSDLKRNRKDFVDDTCCVAYLFPDARDITQPLTNLLGEIDSENVSKRSHLSIEIKVKNGLKSRSPLVSRRIKHSISRFQLNQYSKQFKAQNGSCEMNCGGQFPGISSYDPSGMCSRDERKVMDNLISLLNAPQNYLKISINGNQIFGHDQLDVGILSEKCSDFFSRMPPFHVISSSSHTFPESIDNLLGIISKILSVESALERLQSAQCLDVLDIEGISLVLDVLQRHVQAKSDFNNPSTDFELNYDRNNIQESLSLVAQTLESVDESPHPVDLCREYCGFSFRKEITESKPNNITSNMNNFDSISSGTEGRGDIMELLLRKLQLLQVNESTTEEELAMLRVRCTRMIETLSKFECLQLIKMWLIALAASDASLIITLRELNSAEAERATEKFPVHLQCPSGGGLHFVSTAQSESAAGLLSVTCLDSKKRTFFAYYINFVDLGPKPVGKVVGKRKKEQDMCNHAEYIYEHFIRSNS